MSRSFTVKVGAAAAAVALGALSVGVADSSVASPSVRDASSSTDAAAADVPVSAILGRFTTEPVKIVSPTFKLRTKEPTDVVVQRYVVPAGGSTGWHTHPGPAVITVTQGRLTLFEAHDGACDAVTYGPGTGFLDRGLGHVHMAVNRGTDTVVGTATYLNVPVGGAFKTLVDAPEACAGVS